MAGSKSKPRQRASRKERVRGRGMRLRERDVDVLLALAKMRLLRTSDLSRLFFSAKGTCQKRLRRLFDAGLVRAVVTDLAKENRYALTRFGHTFLTEALEGEEIPAFRSAPRLEGRSVVHLDLLNRYRIALALGATEHGLDLRSFVPEWELRSSDPNANPVPDALAVLRCGRESWCLAVEVDTGSEAPRVVGRKLERYAEALEDGGVFGVRSPLVLIIVAKPRRARTLARTLADGSMSQRIVFGVVPGVLEDGGLTNGLALIADLMDPNGKAEVDPFRRGLVHGQK